MEKQESKEIKERVNAKLSFLDLFPSYEEIDENNEGIIITFQNIDLTYNLTELIKNREELFVPQLIPNQIIKINLIKSNNPHASGPFTVKNGEQWVTFAYEHKKNKTTNFALSLIDCIKIKFFCKMDHVPVLNANNDNNTNNININNQLSNTETQQAKTDFLLNNILPKPSPKKLYGNFTTKKKPSHMNNNIFNNNGSNNKAEHESLHTEESKISKMLENVTPEMKSNNTNMTLNNTTLNISKNTTNNPLIRSENLNEFNPLSSSSGVVGNDFRMEDRKKGKNVKKIYNTNNNLNTNNSLNLEGKKSSENQRKIKSNKNITKERTKINNNSINNPPHTVDNKNWNLNENNGNNNSSKSRHNLKRNKSKTLIDSKNKTDKKGKEKEKSSSNKNNDSKLKKIRKDLSSKNICVKNEEAIELKEDNINNKSNNFFNKNNSIEISNIEGLIKGDELLLDNSQTKKLNEEKSSKTKPEVPEEFMVMDEIDNFGLDNFSKKLEDFQLFYNEEYITNIKEEDFILEIELYIEKLIELITEYHLQIEEKDLEYQLLLSAYWKNIDLYLNIHKQIKKLALIKDNIELKRNNPKQMSILHDKNYVNNLITNKVEISMFNDLLKSKESENKTQKEKLKKILKNLLNKSKYKNIINQNEKIAKWAQLNAIDKAIPSNHKAKKKNKQVKAAENNIKDKGVNKIDKKKKSSNNNVNINSTPSKSKTKFNSKNNQDDKTKKK